MIQPQEKRRRITGKTGMETARASAQASLRASQIMWAKHLEKSTEDKPAGRTVRETVHQGDAQDIYKMRKIHTSHQLSAARNIIFCTACGYWCQLKTEKLRDLCQRIRQSAYYRTQFRRLKKGWHPRKSQWPDGAIGKTPHEVIKITHRVNKQ